MNTVHFVMSDAFAGIEQHVDELLSNNLLKWLRSSNGHSRPPRSQIIKLDGLKISYLSINSSLLKSVPKWLRSSRGHSRPQKPQIIDFDAKITTYSLEKFVEDMV